MKNKKIIFSLLFSLIFLGLNIFVISETLAAGETQKNQLQFIPAMTIPGFYTAGSSIDIDGSTLGNYIVALYRYGGIFAGVVAMFMLVYAAWEWLLAGGNPSKISNAKEKINGTLIGLALLFGGYLLLSLISTNLISFKSLDTALPKPPCSLFIKEKDCPAPSCKWVVATQAEIAADPNFVGKCMNTSDVTTPPEVVIDCKEINFPLWAGDTVIRDCSSYPDVASCNANSCFGKDYKYSDVAGGPLNEVCVVAGDKCTNLRFKSCDSNSDCQISNNPDSRQWCCNNITLGRDKCRPIGGPAGIDASDCKN